MIRDIIALDADPVLFLEKTLDDIQFIDNGLKILLDLLDENTRFMEREEVLEHFLEAEWQYSLVLEEFLGHKGGFSIKGSPRAETLKNFLTNSRQRKKAAESMGAAANTESGESGGLIVSSEELTELLKAF